MVVSKNKVMTGKIHQVSDPTETKRLEAAREKFAKAKAAPRSVVAEGHTYETSPEVITWIASKGPQKGREFKAVGFRSLANPDSSYLAVKLRPRDVRAILACIDDGKRQELEDLLAVYIELSQAQAEED